MLLPDLIGREAILAHRVAAVAAAWEQQQLPDLLDQFAPAGIPDFHNSSKLHGCTGSVGNHKQPRSLTNSLHIAVQ